MCSRRLPPRSASTKRHSRGHIDWCVCERKVVLVSAAWGRTRCAGTTGEGGHVGNHMPTLRCDERDQAGESGPSNAVAQALWTDSSSLG